MPSSHGVDGRRRHVDVTRTAVSTTSDPAVDETDRRIIRHLQVDGRMSNTQIARIIGVSETTVRKRIATLTARGLLNIVAVPTPEAVGSTMSAIIGVSVSLPMIRSVAEACREQPEVRYCGVSAGRYDILLEAFFRDHQHFLDFVSNRIGTLPGVNHIETSIILDVVKFSYEWEIA